MVWSAEAKLTAYGVRANCRSNAPARDLAAGLDRYHEFARQPGRLDPEGVEHEPESLVVSGAALGDVGEHERPVIAEGLHQVAQGAQVPTYFLDRDDVAAAHEAGDRVNVGKVPLR